MRLAPRRKSDFPGRVRHAVAFRVCSAAPFRGPVHARASHRPDCSPPSCRSPAPRRQPPRRSSSPAASTSAPTTSDTGLDCYLDAVVHLYTMCRHVKSIEIIEFGLPGRAGRRQRREERVLRRQAEDQHRAALPGGAARGDAAGAKWWTTCAACSSTGSTSMASLKWQNGRAARRLRGPRQRGVRRAVVQDRGGPRRLLHGARRGRRHEGRAGEAPRRSRQGRQGNDRAKAN